MIHLGIARLPAHDYFRQLHCTLPVNGGARENWPRVGLEAMAEFVGREPPPVGTPLPHLNKSTPEPTVGQVATRPNRFLFDEAIAALRERNGRVIVEVGGIRNRGWRETDGHSTLRWPTDVTVWSVDNTPLAIGHPRFP